MTSFFLNETGERWWAEWVLENKSEGTGWTAEKMARKEGVWDGMKKKERIPANGWRRGLCVGRHANKMPQQDDRTKKGQRVSAARVPAVGPCRSCRCPHTSTSVSRVRRGWSAGHSSPFSALIRYQDVRIHDIIFFFLWLSA